MLCYFYFTRTTLDKRFYFMNTLNRVGWGGISGEAETPRTFN